MPAGCIDMGSRKIALIGCYRCAEFKIQKTEPSWAGFVALSGEMLFVPFRTIAKANSSGYEVERTLVPEPFRQLKLP